MKTDERLRDLFREELVGEITVEAGGTIVLPDGTRTDLAGLRVYEAAEAAVLFGTLRPFEEWVKIQAWSPTEIETARAVARHLAAIAGIPAAGAKGWLTG